MVAQNTKRRPSFAMMSKVLTAPDLDLKASERLVALILLQHADAKTMRCWPSIDTIAARAKMKRQTVCNAIKTLRKLGLVQVTKERSGGKFLRNRYDLTAVMFKASPVPERFKPKSQVSRLALG